ncbi:hypothetical protein KUTeg_008423 [Tegillarca granosa]|uniref:Boule n=1 Tax=Tegillarca granosa TaxID=220873 RepID=A0ABQ9FBT4_TEGGR|nr:hypothetical protein KUTeg_008423 [Tegillarca granosa]
MCRYGFITFENQEDAEKIIKEEADNLVFKERKLNIGPAVRKQPAAAAYSTVMVPQTPTMYVTPQYSAYQQTTPQWTTSPAGQWRWTPQSPASQTVAGSPSYFYAAMHASPELMYAQPPPHAYQPAELTDTAAAVMEAGQAAFEVIPNPFAV